MNGKTMTTASKNRIMITTAIPADIWTEKLQQVESSHDQSEAESLHDQLRSQNRNEKVHSSRGAAD
jgi:hypothetical protein